MKIYVCGGVTHNPGFRQQFAATTARLRAVGHEVIDPTEKFATDNGGELAPVGSPRYEEIMRACFTDVEQCDAVCTLTGWQNSGGATREVELAKKLGKIVSSEDYFVDMGSLKWTGDPECEPQHAYADDAGYDLYVSEDTVIPYRGFADVPLGISVELPKGVWGMITGRSSTVRRRRLLVVQGIIDNGYRGPLFAACQNLGRQEIRIERGERIAQFLLFPMVTPPILHVEELSESDRGTNAFGSSGA
jgi:dUTP pyrophosphatase